MLSRLEILNIPKPYKNSGQCMFDKKLYRLKDYAD